MKNTIKRILALVLTIACVVSLVSCAKPKLDLEKAKANLEENGYVVTVTNSPDAGVESVLLALKNLVSADETQSLTIYKFKSVKLAKLYHQAQVLKIENEIESLELEIKAIKHLINKFENELDSDDIDDYKEDIAEAKQEIAELKDELKTIGRQGKYVWQGDKEAIKATK